MRTLPRSSARGDERRADRRVAVAFGATFVAGGLFVLGALVSRAVELADAATNEGGSTARSLVSSENALVELGRRLFFDPGASHSKRVSCASCHDPDHGFSDRRASSEDDFGTTVRHSQTLLNLPTGSPLHWDGEFQTVEQVVTARTGNRRQVSGSYLRSSESLPEDDCVVGVEEERVDEGFEEIAVVPIADALAATGLYASAFESVFGDPTPTRERFSVALATYVRSLSSTPSAFDRHAAGDGSAMTPAAKRGLELFRGRAGCAQCHSTEGAKPSFTDGRFHDTGIVKHRGSASRIPSTLRVERGRGRTTNDSEFERAFKTPSLRDVALRPPYMHDASLRTLSEVVRYYAIGCGQVKDDRLDPRVVPFGRGRSVPEIEDDVADLVAFLRALTGERRAGLASSAWSARAERMRLRVVDERGRPYRDLVEIRPAGDVVPDSRAAPGAVLHLTPDAEGWIELAPFATTHVRVSFPGTGDAPDGTELRPRSGELVPDTCAEATLVIERAAPVRRATSDASSIELRIR